MNKKCKIGCLIFARYNSKRLRGKVLKKIGKKTLLEIIYLRSRLVFSKKKIVIATTKSKSDDPIVEFCKINNIQFFRGNSNNLIKRSIECCKKYKFTSFARICGDRPIFDYLLLKKMLKIYKNNKYDLVTNCYPKTFASGLTNEIVSYKALIEINKKKNLSKEHKEHMINYIYKNPNNFNILNIKSKFKNKLNKLDFSINKKIDIKFIFKILKKKNMNYTLPTKSYLNFYK
jgi:spore coat polysaccharide biosynthesis protein SpsF